MQRDAEESLTKRNVSTRSHCIAEEEDEDLADPNRQLVKSLIFSYVENASAETSQRERDVKDGKD